MARSGDPCAASAPVVVHATFPDPVYDFSYDVEGIQRLANSAVHKVREGWALGLTRYEPVLEMTAPVTARRTADGSYCARPTSVDVNLGYKDLTVAIPSELDGASCGFEQIIRHEDEHVAVSEHVLRKYLPLVQARLEAELASNADARQPTAEAAIAFQRNMLNATLIDVGNQLSDETTALQQDVDSPEEYHRLLNVCDGELADLVRSTRNGWMLAQGF
jgi:hypothetical protein